jgi:hypothetical protein
MVRVTETAGPAREPRWLWGAPRRIQVLICPVTDQYRAARGSLEGQACRQTGSSPLASSPPPVRQLR